MRIKGFGILVCLLLLAVTSCVEEYWPPINKYEDLMVIDGQITNDPGPYFFRISRTSKIYEYQFIPVSGAQVIISDNTGNSEKLTETEAGIYMTAVNGIRGVTGRSYKVTINTPSDDVYESDFQELPAPTGIDSVYAEIEHHTDIDYSYELSGYQFYLDTEVPVSDTNYYLWQLEYTYKYQADFLIRWYWDGHLNPFPKPDSLQTCWLSDTVNMILTFSTADKTNPQVIRFPLNYVTTETRELSIRYSLMVKMLTLTKKAYLYWSSIEELVSDKDMLFTKQPYQIRGNVNNVNDPDEPVLGYFTVAGVDQKRIFVNRPPVSVNFNYPICVLDQGDFEAMRDVYWSTPKEWPMYITESTSHVKAFPNPICLDCRRRGGNTLKPDFWED